MGTDDGLPNFIRDINLGIDLAKIIADPKDLFSTVLLYVIYINRKRRRF
jgi:hypothetical protein